MADVKDKLVKLRQKVADAARMAGRNAEEIEIMAVTKTKPESLVREAVDAGITLLGENRVQEAREKYSSITGDYRLHLIGHLQRNKAKYVPGLFCCVESIDKLETARALDNVCRQKDEEIDILIEVNTSGEASKSGYLDEKDVYNDLEEYLQFSAVHPVGLMTVGPFTDDESVVRSAFARLRKLYETIRETVDPPGFTVLSMGMSSDYTYAVLEGSTRIRIGSALLGGRQV